jgi:hypothetical protein
LVYALDDRKFVFVFLKGKGFLCSPKCSDRLQRPMKVIRILGFFLERKLFAK